jgi:hypothetical protein
MIDHSALSLTEALRTGRLNEFIDQQEAIGVGPVDVAAFDQASTRVIKHAGLSGQTLRSASHDGSTGKQTR